MLANSVGKFGVAVLGLGRMGLIHCNNVAQSKRASLRWVMRNDVDKAKRLTQHLDYPPLAAKPSELHKILQDKQVEGVVVSSITSAHEAQIKASLDAGKAVLCEKPLTTDIGSTIECYKLAEQNGKPLICAFHRRFDPSICALKDELIKEKSSKLKLIRISSHDNLPPLFEYIKTSGGIVKDSTIHDLDLALWLSGSAAKSVFVQGQVFSDSVRRAGDVDLVVVTIEHHNGTISVIDNGRRCAYGYDQRIEAICEDGSFMVHNRPTHQLYIHKQSGNISPDTDQLFDTRYTHAYSNEMEHFLDVLEGSSPKVTKQETLAAMVLAEAAIESMNSGKTVDVEPF